MLKVQIYREGIAPFKFRKSAENFFGKDLTDEEKFFGEIEIIGEIVSDGKTFLARGQATCSRKFFCDRCLEPASGEIVCNFDEEIDDKDISENVVDITELVRDTFLAGLPIQNLCREDCKGLCPVCGKNLNCEKCECDRLIVDPRLASLKELKLD